MSEAPIPTVPLPPPPEALKVSNKTSVPVLAGVIAKVLRERGVLELEAVGVLAVNQAVKALAACRGYLAPMDLDASFTVAFADVPDSRGEDGRPLTMLRFRATRTTR